MCPHTQTHTSWSCSPPSTVWLNQREREINLPEYSLVNPPGSWWEYASMVDVAAVEFTLKQTNKAPSEGVRVFVNERCSQWFLDCAAANRATASLQRRRTRPANPSLLSAGPAPKAHVTRRAAGNQTVERTCPPSWPTSSLLFNYSRALKRSSVWPAADSPTVVGPGVSSLTEVPFKQERVRVCTPTLAPLCCCYLHTHNIANNRAQNFDFPLKH